MCRVRGGDGHQAGRAVYTVQDLRELVSVENVNIQDRTIRSKVEEDESNCTITCYNAILHQNIVQLLHACLAVVCSDCLLE